MGPCFIAFVENRKIKIFPLLSLSFSVSFLHSAAIATETATSDPPPPLRVVMTVYEFYYGVFSGDQALQIRGPVKLTAPFHCKKCLYTTKRNME